MKKINTLLVLTLFLFVANANAQRNNKIKGSGPVVTESVDMKTISNIGLGISANVYLTQGSTQKIEIIGQQNIIDIITKDNDGDSWTIETKKGYSYSTKEKLEVHITLKDLESINLGGSGSIYGENKFSNLDDLDINIGGSGSVNLDLVAAEVDCKIGGSGSIKLEGSAEELSAKIGGSGSVKAIDLEVKNASVKAAGSGSVQINVSDNLDATIAGSGGVKYKGNPQINKTVVGSGRIKAY